MFDSIGFSEMMLLAVLALVVVGPKDLPLMMRKLGQMMNRVRAMAADFRASFDEMARQAELDELRKEVEALRNLKPLEDVREEFSKPFDFDGTSTIHSPDGPAPDLLTPDGQPELPAAEPTAAPVTAQVSATSSADPAAKPAPKPRKRAAKPKVPTPEAAE